MPDHAEQRITHAAPIELTVELAPRINLAFQQNGVPVVRHLQIACQGDGPYENLQLTMRAKPDGLAQERSWLIATLKQGETVSFPSSDVVLRPGVLSDVTDPVRGEFEFTLRKGDDVLATAFQPVELLAHNEWVGLNEGQGILAAFVTPNDQVIDPILRDAAVLLRNGVKRTPTVDGYASGSRERVWEMASAIWSAVCQRDLAYALPPASFETRGQKIRMAGQVISSGAATCLDSSVLFASALEQAGLHPFIVLTRGHAFPGVWLTEQTFETVVMRDVAALRTQLNNRDALVFESTLATQDKRARFTDAIDMATASLSADRSWEFHAVIDIARARMMDIFPLGAARQPHDAAATMDPRQAIERAPKLPNFRIARGEERTEDRLERWKSKLQDLSKRNPLINLSKSGRTTFDLAGDKLASLEEALAARRKLTVRPSPDLALAGANRDETDLLGNLLDRFAHDALGKDELIVDEGEAKLTKRLIGLLRQTETDRREAGGTTSFVTMGFLHRPADSASDKPSRTPILLRPVSLGRDTVRSPIFLRRNDEPPLVNPALIQLLKQEYGLDLSRLEDALPQNGDAVDVDALFHAIGQEIRSAKGWEIERRASIARLSFAKHVMWRDLSEREDVLRNNRIVNAILTPKPGAFSDQPKFEDAQSLDANRNPDKLITPLPADASQLVAVQAAAAGKSFVLVGPPGTGKSQTIANIIARSLGEGKRVLFVAEKTAALEVVQQRLSAIGLGELCLELHSHKSNRANVVAHLERAWKQARVEAPEHWGTVAASLASARKRLVEDTRELARRGPGDQSAYNAVGEAVRWRESPKISLDWGPVSDGGAQSREALLAIAERCDELDIELSGVGEHVLRGVGLRSWTPQSFERLIAAAERLSSAASELHDNWPAIAAALGLDPTVRRADVVHAALYVASRPRFINRHAFRRTSAIKDGRGLAQLHEIGALFNQRAVAARLCSARYTLDRVDEQQIKALRKLWTQAETSPKPLRWILELRVRTKLSRLARGRAVRDPVGDLPRLQDIGRINSALDASPPPIDAISRSWRGAKTNSRLVLGLCAYAALRSTLDPRLHRDDALRKLGRACASADSLAAIRPVIQTWIGAVAQFERTAEAPIQMVGQLSSGDWLGDMTSFAARCAQAQGDFHAWCAWRDARAAAIDNGLDPALIGIESGVGRRAPKIAETVRANHARWWLHSAITDRRLSSAQSPGEQSAERNRFIDLDKQSAKLAPQAIRARLAERAPAYGESSEGEGWVTLWREFGRRRSRMSLRNLVAAAGEQMKALTPCFLMSPLSVAQYLGEDRTGFDLVIFDEASQIPVWDAAGALARAKQAIVVGDPKQLPPTSFFSRTDGEDWDGEGSENDDMESVLDDCIAAGMPTWRLQWHYRSRAERLINFSNQAYYDGELVTFPAPTVKDASVSLVRVNGVYERGSKQINRVEANAVVDAIKRQWRHSDPDIRRASIGVITMNVKQQRLIQDLIDDARRELWDQGHQLNDIADDAVIVRSLEAIQGDERDVVMLSIGYGPDRDGHMTMNFGPLNAMGGERRLNVAATRARKAMLIFSSFDPEDIDLSRTQARGVSDLKSYLIYARDGVGTGGDEHSSIKDDHLAIAIADRLNERGWRTHRGVGASRARVAIAVEHPNRPGEYFAAINPIGDPASASMCVRDREVLRPTMLKGLGWRVHSARPLEWLADPAAAADRLSQALEADLADLLDETDTEGERQSATVGVVLEMRDRFARLPAQSGAGQAGRQALPAPARECQ